ncbi:MAG: RteC domain-containing protein [Sphingobacterium sp.]|jgi:hypothetical protein|uniref:RteC domain-containing protein n=1 Tax=Sphingobacterium sp. TaxID=341027 RepID=UPI00283C0CB6|nr:RteC domain-containing protein [Sphingobacterium sp.]MDR3008599.1 RteC domain-containing protein [Sphingobacterium sp.]
MIKIAQKLHQELKEQLQELDFNGITGLEYYRKGYQLSNNILKKIRSALTGYKFKNEEEEIEFFKSIKPQIHAEVIFYIECYRTELDCPQIKDKKAQLSYLKQLSVYYAQLINKNNLIKLYYLTERKDEDNLLFLRNRNIDSFIPFDPLQEFDELFPPASTEFARIIAYERVLKVIGEKMKAIREESKGSTSRQIPALTWTASKSALIELAYAFHSTCVLNNGNIDVKSIIILFEQIFNSDLGNFYRTFQNIRIRDNRTAFLDELKDKLMIRMDNTDLNAK